jgi:hypothetical protein
VVELILRSLAKQTALSEISVTWKIPKRNIIQGSCHFFFARSINKISQTKRFDNEYNIKQAE